jgi:hypothetical protein
MARYIQNAHMGEVGPDEYKDFRTVFHGASEAPRVHGMLGDTLDKLPRFKNHYFVAFHYTDLGPTNANPKSLIDVMHRIKSVDAPKFDIDTETLNQYNKPRIVPLRINYQPITITFHDDKSNYTTDFWRRIYQFYFLNGQRLSNSQYSTRDSDVVIDNGATIHKQYNDYGYYIGNKENKKNLFYHMSLYMLQNGMCTRMDLVNPQLQSMQHDLFSQDMSGELAQNTTIWGYENVVYYSSRAIDAEQTLGAHGFHSGNSTIFQPAPGHYDEETGKTVYRETYTTTATGESTAPKGNSGGFEDDIIYDDDFESAFDYSTSAQPVYTLATKTPEVGFMPKSGLDSKISHFYWALATGREDLLLNPIEAAAAKAAEATATAVDDFSGHTKFGDQQAAKNVDTFGETNVGHVDDFSAVPKNQTGLDKTKTESEASGQAIGTNFRPTTLSNTDPSVWTDPNTGKNIVVPIVGGTMANLVQKSKNWWAGLTPKEQDAHNKAKAADREYKEQNASG